MFYDKFVSLCASIGKKPTPVAKELGISKGTVASWKKRGNDPTDAYLAMIANYFGVSVADLRGKKKTPPAWMLAGRLIRLKCWQTSTSYLQKSPPHKAVG